MSKILAPNEIAYLAGEHWTGEDQVIAVAVAYAESKGDPDIVVFTWKTVDNVTTCDNTDLGLMQISTKWHQLTGDGKPGRLMLAGADWRDPVVNMRLAKQIFDEFVRAGKSSGWEAWKAYTSGNYKKYLPLARGAVQATWPPPGDDATEIGERLKNAVQ